jgi:hypothetical protein
MPDIQIEEIVERIASVDSIIRPAFYELSNHTPLALSDCSFNSGVSVALSVSVDLCYVHCISPT